MLSNRLLCANQSLGLGAFDVHFYEIDPPYSIRRHKVIERFCLHAHSGSIGTRPAPWARVFEDQIFLRAVPESLVNNLDPGTEDRVHAQVFVDDLDIRRDTLETEHLRASPREIQGWVAPTATRVYY